MDNKKILIVDDEADIVYALRLELEANGFNVIVAADGQDALDKARVEKPDLIVLDLMLPRIEGYKVCRMLKFDKKYNMIPVVILTARVQKADEKLGFEVGADAFITKPYEPSKLLSKIKELLKMREAG